METEGADDEIGDGDLVRLRSFECRLLDCGFTSLERKPGAIFITCNRAWHVNQNLGHSGVFTFTALCRKFTVPRQK